MESVPRNALSGLEACITAFLAELARLTPDTGKDFALLVETAEGLRYEGYSSMSQTLCGSGQTFPTVEAADAYLMRRGSG